MEEAEVETDSSTDVVARIQAIIDHYGLNANSASKKLGYFNTSKLYKILQGSAPSYPTLVDILKTFPEVSPSWLVLGIEPMLLAEKAPQPVSQLPPAWRREVVNSGQVLAITVDMDGEENVELVPIQAQAGYTLQHNEPVYLRDLPKYRIPGFERGGTFRAFEVAGDSMEPTLNHRDIVVASFLDNWRLLEPGEVYVVVTAESVMLKRIKERIKTGNTTVTLHSDNHHRHPYELEVADILELWRVRGFISTYLPSAPDITMERLWETIEQLGYDRGVVRRHLEENDPDSAPSVSL